MKLTLSVFFSSLFWGVSALLKSAAEFVHIKYRLFSTGVVGVQSKKKTNREKASQQSR